MNSDEYLKNRVQDQIVWYDKKSKFNQKLFKVFRISEIILAATIPFLSGLVASIPDFERYGIIIIGLIGVFVTIIASVLGLGQYQEHWIEYRTTCESLKKEKFLFQTGVEPYNDKNSFELLVQRIETLVSKENTNWAQFMMKPEKEKKNG